MNDIRRTILWVVFSASLFLLWDGWNKHNGHPSFFAPPLAKPVASVPSGGATAASASAGVPVAATMAGSAAAVPSTAASAPTASEVVVINTDVLKASFDSRGGDLVRLEFKAYTDATDPTHPVVLFDRSAQRVYLAQTGLVTTQSGLSLPNHLTVMSVVPGERSLKDGVDALTLRFVSPDTSGATLTKTYSFKRGQYTIGVNHQVHNGGAAAITPQLYLQLTRDGNPPPGESSFYSTFTGPAMYTEASKFKKIEFKDIEKAAKDGKQPDHDRTGDAGWVAMVQHYFAAAWLVNAPGPREFRTARVSDNLYSIAMVLPLGEVAPGADKQHEAVLFAGPQEEKKLEALAPGLELVSQP